MIPWLMTKGTSELDASGFDTVTPTLRGHGTPDNKIGLEPRPQSFLQNHELELGLVST